MKFYYIILFVGMFYQITRINKYISACTSLSGARDELTSHHMNTVWFMSKVIGHALSYYSFNSLENILIIFPALLTNLNGY